jgi:hypothetical protein
MTNIDHMQIITFPLTSSITNSWLHSRHKQELLLEDIETCSIVMLTRQTHVHTINPSNIFPFPSQ